MDAFPGSNPLKKITPDIAPECPERMNEIFRLGTVEMGRRWGVCLPPPTHCVKTKFCKKPSIWGPLWPPPKKKNCSQNI